MLTVPEKCLQVIRKVDPQLDGSEVGLLTDGEDNTVKNCVNEVIKSGVIIHFVALGPSADPAVTQMRNQTG